MAGNITGTLFRLTSFGESHGDAIGGVIEGCPPGFKPDIEMIQQELNRRKTAASGHSSKRMEEDKVEFISGLKDGITLGSPIAFLIKNADARPLDYADLESVYRPSHADFSYQEKYGTRDRSGGGRSSARETAIRVVAGALAKQLLATKGIEIVAYTSGVGELQLSEYLEDVQLQQTVNTYCGCPVKEIDAAMQNLIMEASSCGDSIGCRVDCVIRGLPSGIGEPVFDRLDAELAKALMNIPAAKAVEIGSGVDAARMKGSAHNDAFYNSEGTIKTKTNFSGGIQGGISNGMPVTIKVSLKPPSSISLPQQSVSLMGKETQISVKGRHDACLVPRVLVVVEAMVALTIVDLFLRNKAIHL